MNSPDKPEQKVGRRAVAGRNAIERNCETCKAPFAAAPIWYFNLILIYLAVGFAVAAFLQGVNSAFAISGTALARALFSSLWLLIAAALVSVAIFIIRRPIRKGVCAKCASIRPKETSPLIWLIFILGQISFFGLPALFAYMTFDQTRLTFETRRVMAAGDVHLLIAKLELAKLGASEIENISAALGRLGDKSAVPALCNALHKHTSFDADEGDKDDGLRNSILGALQKLADSTSIPSLADYAAHNKFTYWRADVIDAMFSIDPMAAGAAVCPMMADPTAGDDFQSDLKRHDWSPKSEREQVYYHLASRNAEALRANWPQTNAVLKGDLLSSSYNTIWNALSAYIRLGRSEMIPDLVQELQRRGTKTMAEAYLNCGHQELVEAGRKWASSHGYEIRSVQGAAAVQWGEL